MTETDEPFQVRALYNNTVVAVVPSWQMHVFMNGIPRIHFDGGVARRLRVFKYPARFEADLRLCQPDNGVYPLVPTLGARFGVGLEAGIDFGGDLRDELVLLLLEYHRAVTSPAVPGVIKDASMELKHSDDPRQEFLSGAIRAGDAESSVQAKTLWAAYQVWARARGFSHAAIKTAIDPNFVTAVQGFVQTSGHGRYVPLTNGRRHVLWGWALAEDSE